MYSIFYDLETTDKNTIGQILNYSFICVDQDFNIVQELSDKVRISRLQLPSPSAILANRVNVVEHQAEVTQCEPEAMLKIAEFIDSCIVKANQKVSFVGFNSSRFDLPFLRTSFIRNGINPYFMGKLIYRDLLFLAKKLSVSQKDFPRLEKDGASSKDGTKRISLSLEVLTNHFGLLQGKQSHESRDDVLITIALAKKFLESYDLDFRSYEPYEVAMLHKNVRSGEVVYAQHPQYNLAIEELNVNIPMTLLDADHRYALWIDLERYAQGKARQSISWINQNGGCFFVDKNSVAEDDLRDLAQKALKEFEKTNLRNFFEISTCDIEQDIYRLDMSTIDLLKKAFWHGDKRGIAESKNKDAKIVMLRHELASYQWGGAEDQKVRDMLRKYALHRYGGKMQIEKWSFKEGVGANNNNTGQHEKLSVYLGEIEKFNKNAALDDRALLESLKEFYLSSDIYNVCGQELLTC